MVDQDISETPIHNTPPPLIEVSGTNLEMGRQIGESRRPQIHKSIENTKQFFVDSYHELKLSWERAKVQAQQYLQFAKEHRPKCLDEIHGIAEGSNATFEDVFLLHSLEDIAVDTLHLNKCTNFAVNGNLTENGHVLVAHNEDWAPEDEDDVFIIHAHPKDDVPFLAMSYGGLLPNIGFNAAGIAQCCNTVRPNDVCIGIPRIIVSRAVLFAQNIINAIQYATIPYRAAGYNHLLAHESGELYNVEVSSKQFALLYGEDDYVLHTNHYLDERMKLIDKTPSKLVDTQSRYFRARKLLKSTSKHSLSSLMKIQQDHVNYPFSICNHTMDALGQIHAKKTINAIIMDLTEKKLHLAWGSPCKNPYFTFELNC